jgi:GT2 family glycosyltransferase
MNALYHLSVILPTYRRCASVERALRSLAQQTLPPTAYEVIVSIDGSDDGTREMVAQFPAPYKLRGLWQPNQGRAAACNAGIHAATGEVLVLLDDDMEATPGFLRSHLQAHPAGSRLGVMGAVPIHVNESSPPVVAYVGAKFNQHLEKLAQPGYQLKLRDFYSGNFSIRRDVLPDVGLFDEAFKIYGNEDLELSLRLARAGVQLVYRSEALAHQHYTKDFAGLARDNIAKGRTAVLLASKHPETFHGLKLDTFTQEWRKWRLLRAGLLGISRLWPGTPKGVIAFMHWLEQRRPAQLHLYYALVLDYCYWVGVQASLRENRRTGRGLASLAGLKHVLPDSPVAAQGSGTLSQDTYIKA